MALLRTWWRTLGGLMVVAFAMAFVAGSAIDAVACQDEGSPVGVAGDLHYVLVADDSEPDPIHSAVETCAHGHCHHLGLGFAQGQDVIAGFKLSAANPRGQSQEELALTLPYSQVNDLSAYRIAVGLKPTPEELDYNRRSDGRP